MTIIKADYLYRLRSFVSKEQSRYYLGGVCIQSAPNGGIDHEGKYDPNRGAILVATDGHRMGVFYDETAIVSPEHEGAIIAFKPEIVRALKPVRGDSGQRFASIDKQCLTIRIAHERVSEFSSELDMLETSNASQTFAEALIDGTFPDWLRVIPEEPVASDGFFAYNANYLGAFKECSKAKTAPIRLFAKDESAPAIVRTDMSEFLGVLMPVRAENAGIASEIRPHWLNAKQEREAA